VNPTLAAFVVLLICGLVAPARAGAAAAAAAAAAESPADLNALAER
jgi:hypothetical protein